MQEIGTFGQICFDTCNKDSSYGFNICDYVRTYYTESLLNQSCICMNRYKYVIEFSKLYLFNTNYSSGLLLQDSLVMPWNHDLDPSSWIVIPSCPDHMWKGFHFTNSSNLCSLYRARSVQHGYVSKCYQIILRRMILFLSNFGISQHLMLALCH